MNELIFWGILVSLVFTELTGLSPGGVIVPAYFVLYFHDPMRMVLTLGMSLLCIGIVRLLSNFMILYGRRRFAVYLLLGIVLKVIFAFIFTNSPVAVPNLSLSIGYVIPGLLGREAERQGVGVTFVALGVVVCVLRLAQMALMG